MPGSVTFSSGNEILTPLGGLAVTAAFTFAVCIYPTAVTNQIWLEERNTGLFQMGIDTGTPEWFMWGGASQLSLGTTTTKPAVNTWQTQIARKPAGASQTVRMSRLVHTTGATAHENASQLMHDATAVTGWRLGRYTGGGFDFPGSMALAAGWTRYLSDSEVESLTTYENVRKLGPAAVWPLGLYRWGADMAQTSSSFGAASATTVTGTAYNTDGPPGYWPNQTSWTDFPKALLRR